MTDVRLSVPEIHCNHCKESIEMAVATLDGVDKVEVKIDEATVDVSFADPATRERIVDAIVGQGYGIA